MIFISVFAINYAMWIAVFYSWVARQARIHNILVSAIY